VPVAVLDRTLSDGVVALRPVARSDGPAILAALSTDTTVARWTRVPWPYTRAHLEEFLRAVEAWHRGAGDLALAVTDATSGEFLGCMGLHRIAASDAPRSAFLPDEVGYWLCANARGRGVATRALRLLAQYALVDLHRPRVNLQTKVGNDASVAVARKVGFVFVGRVYAGDIDDDDVDHDRFVLTLAGFEMAARGSEDAAGGADAAEAGMISPSAP
jgi:RimJ/RimL family protein N-acetyltransferase